MKKILIITSVESGGEWHVVYEVIKGLYETRKYSFDLVCISSQKIKKNDLKYFTHIEYILPISKRKPFKYIKQLTVLMLNIRESIKKSLKRMSYDWVIVTDYVGRIAILTIPNAWNIPVVFFFHGIKSSIIRSLKQINYFELLVKLLERISIIFSHIVVVPSEYGKNLLLKMIFPFKRKIYVIPNCISDVFLKNKTENIIYKRNLLTVIYAGRLVEYKGIKLIIDAVINMNLKNYNIRLKICYPIENADQNLLCYIIEKNKEYPHIISLYPNLNQRKLINQYRSSDVLILPSIFEISPISILEAFSQGALCIASDTGDIRDVLSGIDNRFILSSISVKSIEDSLTWMYSLPFHRRREYTEKALSIATRHSKKRTIEFFDLLLEK